jgi:hypothetical protein
MTAAEVPSGKSRSKMAPCERPTCTTIITYYSAVAHIVSIRLLLLFFFFWFVNRWFKVAGVAIILMLTFTFFVPYSHTSVSILFSILYAIAQLVLGSALLCGIFKVGTYFNCFSCSQVVCCRPQGITLPDTSSYLYWT